MTRYSVKASGNPTWKTYKSCEIGISLAHPSHQDFKLLGLLEWADKNFEKVVITLSDTLYRYNLMAQGMSDSQAFMTSQRMGDAWIERNRFIISKFDNPKFIVQRWNEWLSHIEYESIHAEIVKFYHEDMNFSICLEQDVGNFINRSIASAEESVIKRAEISSRRFLLEELSAYILIARTHKALRVYPAKDMRCFQYFRNTDNIPSNLRGLDLAPHVDVNFKRKQNTKQEAA